jgi:hypothetical protein
MIPATIGSIARQAAASLRMALAFRLLRAARAMHPLRADLSFSREAQRLASDYDPRRQQQGDRPS